MTLPPIQDDAPTPRIQRPIVFAAVVGGGVCLWTAIVAITVLGWHTDTVSEVAITGLVSIASALAGGFAGWIARDRVRGDA